MVPYDPYQVYTDALHLVAPSNAVYYVKRSYEDISINQIATTNLYTARTFALSSVSDYASFTGVFDLYKICAVEVKYMPRENQAPVTATVASLFYTVIDYDDSTVLTSISSATNYENCIVSQGYQGQRRCFVPHLAVAAYGGSTFTSYTNMLPEWIDSASPTVPHYGCKEVYAQGNAGVVNTMDVFVTLLLAFKASR